MHMFYENVDYGYVAYYADFSSTRPDQLPLKLNSFVNLHAEGRTCALLFSTCETLKVSKADELRLGAFERKILRRIYGPICEGAVWRSRYNEELYHLYDETDLVTTVRITRLRWAGHIV